MSAGDRPTLAERLTVRPAGAPDAEVRHRRERLCTYLREVEGRVHGARGEAAAEVRALLGWDDETLDAFIASPLVTHSSPHTGMNAFPPMLCFPWAQRSLQTLSAAGALPGRPIHLRTIVVHNNLGDLRWRPYAWWHRGAGGRVEKTAFFPRRHGERRKVLLALPVPAIDPARCCGSDRRAISIARHARNYAYFALLYRASLEREAGFHLPHGTLEAPLNLLNAAVFRDESLAAWAAALERVSTRRFRTVGTSGELVELGAANAPAAAAALAGASLIGPNFLSFAQIYAFGITALIGAEKMARYVAEMNGEVAALHAAIGWKHPFPALVPITRLPIGEVVPLDEDARSALAGWGIAASLPIAVADHGSRLKERLDALLAREYREMFPGATSARSS